MLRLLLHEEISLNVAAALRRRSQEIDVRTLAEWEDGNFVGRDLADILREAADQQLTLVTYDRLRIPPILKDWSEEECLYGGVIFLDDESLPPEESLALAAALTRVHQESGNWEWTNRVLFLR